MSYFLHKKCKDLPKQFFKYEPSNVASYCSRIIDQQQQLYYGTTTPGSFDPGDANFEAALLEQANTDYFLHSLYYEHEKTFSEFFTKSDEQKQFSIYRHNLREGLLIVCRIDSGGICWINLFQYQMANISNGLLSLKSRYYYSRDKLSSIQIVDPQDMFKENYKNIDLIAWGSWSSDEGLVTFEGERLYEKSKVLKFTWIPYFSGTIKSPFDISCLYNTARKYGISDVYGQNVLEEKDCLRLENRIPKF